MAFADLLLQTTLTAALDLVDQLISSSAVVVQTVCDGVMAHLRSSADTHGNRYVLADSRR